MAVSETDVWWGRLDPDVRGALIRHTQGAPIPEDLAMKVGRQVGLDMWVLWDAGPMWSVALSERLLEFLRQKAAEA